MLAPGWDAAGPLALPFTFKNYAALGTEACPTFLYFGASNHSLLQSFLLMGVALLITGFPGQGIIYPLHSAHIG